MSIAIARLLHKIDREDINSSCYRAHQCKLISITFSTTWNDRKQCSHSGSESPAPNPSQNKRKVPVLKLELWFSFCWTSVWNGLSSSSGLFWARIPITDTDCKIKQIQINRMNKIHKMHFPRNSELMISRSILPGITAFEIKWIRIYMDIMNIIIYNRF